MDVLVRGGLVVTAAGSYEADVGIAGGRIAAVAMPGAGPAAAEEIDARGRWVLPGVVDLHVHFRDPGQTHKEDFGTGTAAAAGGGVTTVADMPNTAPPTTTPERYETKLRSAAGRAHVDFALWAGGLDTSHYPRYRELGAIGLKIYMAGPGQGEQYPGELAVRDDGTLYEVLRAAGAAGLPAAVHLSNPAIEETWRRAWRGRPFADLADAVAAESRLDKLEAAQRALLLAEHAGAHIHLVHVPAAVLPLVAAAKARGVRVTAESFLPFMTTDLIPAAGALGFDRYRRPGEAAALWEAMRSGPVDTVATDHAPHTLAEKRRADRDLPAAPSGYPELETALPMMLDQVHRGTLALPRLVELMCSAPARFAGLPGRKGSIAPGLDADLVIVDPDEEWTIRAGRLRTKAGWTPFEGRRVRGRIRRVLLRGETVARDGEVIARAGRGKALARGWPT